MKNQEIKIRGLVEVKNGKTHFQCHNKIVSQGLRDVINLFAAAAATTRSATAYAALVGTDIATATTENMTALVAADANYSDSKAGATSSPGAGTYRMTLTYTWNAGTLGAIDIGEIGIHLGQITGGTLSAFNATTAFNTTLLFSRVSNADGEFVHFTNDVGHPLVITWTLEVVFA